MKRQRGAHAQSAPIAKTSELDKALAFLSTHRRDAILEGVAISAKELLRSSDLQKSLLKVIERIGLATDVDRVHILEIDPKAPIEEGRVCDQYLWSAVGISTPPEYRNAKGTSLVGVGLASWVPRFLRGETIFGQIRHFDETARKFFEIGGLKSTLAVPIFLDEHWWGFIAFDDCRAGREWLPSEIDTINTLAELIGATISSLRHAAILEAVATSAKSLLRASDLRQSLQNVMELLGHATGVDRVHIIEIDTDAPSEHTPVAHHYVWVAPGVSRAINFENVKDSIADIGLASWMPRFIRGETIIANTRDIDAPARALFEKGDIKSILAVPVFVDGRWWGLIAFDDCRLERRWGYPEVETFKTLAEMVGAAVGRARHLSTLADANRIIEASPTILYRLDPVPPFGLCYISQNMRQYGYTAEELLATSNRWAELIAEEDFPDLMHKIDQLVSGHSNHVQIEFRLKKPDGTFIWFDGEGYALRNGAGELTAIEGILTDITGLKQKAFEIAAMAHTDSLTGLPNRPAFIERLNLEFARARRGRNQFALHYLDLDHFKDVNDTLGHPFGDKLLEAVAGRLASCMQETDMIARLGGDEFAMLQDDIADATDIEMLAQRVCTALSAPFTIDGNQVLTTVSIGIVPYSGDVIGVDAMMMKADLALYRAKNDGRNRFRFHVTELDEQTRARIVIGEQLKHAVERHELEVYYQPQVGLKSGSIEGLEALIRWNHPNRGLLLPMAFIPIAETTGTIVAIGESIIEQVCRQMRAWDDQGIVLPLVAVNISGAQFKLGSRLDQIVTENLIRYNIAPTRLELEITESILIETTQRYSEIFKRLHQIGVHFAIDDFGTGYSSLDYLRSYRFARLKIDGRFVEGVATNVDDAVIVRATIGLAHELGMKVVAEGVETEAQREFLISASCEFAQGHYFGAAVTAIEIGEMMRHKRHASEDVSRPAQVT